DSVTEGGQLLAQVMDVDALPAGVRVAPVGEEGDPEAASPEVASPEVVGIAIDRVHPPRHGRRACRLVDRPVKRTSGSTLHAERDLPSIERGPLSAPPIWTSHPIPSTSTPRATTPASPTRVATVEPRRRAAVAASRLGRPSGPRRLTRPSASTTAA